MESVGDVENIKVEKKESRIWKAAKVGVLALGLMAFGKNLKAEELMKTPFVKEHYENGTVIEYEYRINDKDTSQVQRNSYFNSEDNTSNTDTDVSIYLKNNTGIGRTFFQIEMKRNRNGTKSKYWDKSIGGDYSDAENNDKTKVTDGFIGIGTGIAPDGVNEKIRFGIGYYSEEIQRTHNMSYHSLTKNIGVGIDYNMIIYGDMENYEKLNEDVNGTYEGSKLYLQYLINKNITPIVWFTRAKGTINQTLDYSDEYIVTGDLCYLGSCGPAVYYFGFENHVRNEIETSKSEIGVRLPITLGKNLIVGEYNKATIEYKDTDSSFDNFLEKEIIRTINLYYKREIIRNLAIKIGYTHTLEKIIRLYNEEKKQDSKLVVGTQLKF